MVCCSSTAVEPRSTRADTCTEVFAKIPDKRAGDGLQGEDDLSVFAGVLGCVHMQAQ